MHSARARRRFLRAAAAFVAAASLLVAAASSSPAQRTPVRAHAAATCADYPTQAAAQGAADTRDPDGDGI